MDITFASTKWDSGRHFIQPAVFEGTTCGHRHHGLKSTNSWGNPTGDGVGKMFQLFHQKNGDTGDGIYNLGIRYDILNYNYIYIYIYIHPFKEVVGAEG